MSIYFEYFPREACLILEQSTLLEQPDIYLKKLCQFLEIDTQYIFSLTRSNISKYKRSIPQETADLLRAYYMPYNEKLFDLLGKEFQW